MSPLRLLLLTVALLPGLVFVRPAQAQVDTSRTVLPDIAPREFEIRGELEIDFPTLQRQPLIGFNPPPRVPDLPADRRPFVESFRQASADLEASPLQRPVPPSALRVGAYPPAEGLIEAGAGRHFSRYALARIASPISTSAALLARLDYEGTDGHEPFSDNPDIRAPQDALEGSLGIAVARTRWSAGVAVDGAYESYTLFGLQSEPSTVDTLSVLPDRTGGHLAARAHIESLHDGPFQGRLDIEVASTRSETAFSAETLSLEERRVTASTEVYAPLSTAGFWLNGTVSSGTLADDLGGQTSVDVGAGLRFEMGSRLTFSAGGRFLAAYSDTDQPRAGADRTRIGYASADLRLEARVAPGIRLYAQNKPSVTPNALGDVFRDQPYLLAQPALRPSLRAIDAEAGANLYVGPVQLALRGGYQDIPQLLYVEHAGVEESGFAAGLSALRYGEAEIYHAGGSLSVVLPGGLHATVGATYRDGRLTRDDVDIPYFSPLVGEATLSYSFLQSRGLVQVTGYVEGERYRDRLQTRRLDPYFDLDVEGSYNVTDHLGVVLRVANLAGTDNQRWDHYPEASVVISGGVRVFW